MGLYYECHVTVEPVFDDRLIKLEDIACKHGFKVASLLMQKREEDKPIRSKFDTFATKRGDSYDKLLAEANGFTQEARSEDFVVWRMKIEDTLTDVRYK